MGFDHKTFAAAIINMAVKKYLSISEKDGVYTLTRAQTDKAALAPEEKTVAAKLLDSGDRIELKNVNHARLSESINTLGKWLRRNLEKVYFFTNGRYLIPGLVWSVLVLVLSLLSAPGEMRFVGLFLMLWLMGWSAAVYSLIHGIIPAWKAVFHGGGSKGEAIGAAVIESIVAFVFTAAEIFVLAVVAYLVSAAFVALLVSLLLVNALFHYLLKRERAWADSFSTRSTVSKCFCPRSRRTGSMSCFLSRGRRSSLKNISPMRSPSMSSRNGPNSFPTSSPKPAQQVILRPGTPGRVGAAWEPPGLRRRSAVRFRARSRPPRRRRAQAPEAADHPEVAAEAAAGAAGRARNVAVRLSRTAQINLRYS